MSSRASSFEGKGTFVSRGLEVSQQGNTERFRTETASIHPKVKNKMSVVDGHYTLITSNDHLI